MNKPKIRKVYKQVLALIAIPFILTGCKKTECNISERHVHKYVGSNKRGTITNYFDFEDEKYEDYYQDGNYGYFTYLKQDDYIEITKEDEAFYEAKGKMFKGEDNWDFLFSLMQGKKDHIEYCSESDDGFGNAATSWFTSKPSGFNGRIRVYHYRFCGHRLVYQDGKWINERSPFVDDIREIINEYPYFEIDCYTQVYKEYKVDRNLLKSIKLEDYDEFTGPDLDNPELYTNKK